jgi:hypothetical protein
MTDAFKPFSPETNLRSLFLTAAEPVETPTHAPASPTALPTRAL